MDPAGRYDPRHGIQQIIAGSGGEALDTLATEANGSYSNPNVVAAQDQAFGVLKLTLGPDGYSWDYKPALAGSAACRG
jgi:hypothetical protein